MINHSFELSDYITAKSPMGLRRRMLEINAKYGAKFHFKYIQQYKNARGNVEWIAWYERQHDTQDIEKLNGRRNKLESGANQ